MSTAKLLLESGFLGLNPWAGLAIGGALLAAGATLSGAGKRAQSSAASGARAQLDREAADIANSADRVRGPEEREDRTTSVNVFIESDMLDGPIETRVGEMFRNNRAPLYGVQGM